MSAVRPLPPSEAVEQESADKGWEDLHRSGLASAIGLDWAKKRYAKAAKACDTLIELPVPPEPSRIWPNITDFLRKMAVRKFGGTSGTCGVWPEKDIFREH